MLIDNLFTTLIEDIDSLEENDYALLSDLNDNEYNNFVNTWNILDLESKSKLIGRLYELSEENSDLNFEKLFKLGLQSTDESIIYSSLEGLWESEGHDTLRRLIRLANTNLSPHVKGSVMTHISRFILLGHDGRINSVMLENIHQLLKSAYTNKDEPTEIRRRALESLGYFDDLETQEYIKEAYASNNPVLKVSSIYSMGKTCNDIWIPILIEELKNEDPEVRYESVEALVEIGQDDCADVLMDLITDDDQQVRLSIISGLGKLGTLSSKELLLGCLEDDNDEIAEAARIALENIDFLEDPLGL